LKINQKIEEILKSRKSKLIEEEIQKKDRNNKT
jgi:hypothetical protein